jgi:GNAT superfamily N-acetyltransferase
MPEIEIRPAVSTDIQALVNLAHSYQTNYVWQMDRTMEDGQVIARFREVRLPRLVRVEYPNPGTWLLEGWKQQPALLVAVFAGDPVGYICLTEQLSAGSAWVKDLVVGEKLRRKGIATALLLAAQDWAGQHRYRRLILEMQSKNNPAIRMALKLGYDFCGYNDHYYANQDIALFFARYLR